MMIEKLPGRIRQRDKMCWLCEGNPGLDISHQINIAENEAFVDFRPMEHFQSTLTHLMQTIYSRFAQMTKFFPDWILIPDESTLEKYIQHEDENYDYRCNLVPHWRESLQRTLPIIDRTQ
jgi:hypothetical protein